MALARILIQKLPICADKVSTHVTDTRVCEFIQSEVLMKVLLYGGKIG